jgi:hypothetical protein
MTKMTLRRFRKKSSKTRVSPSFLSVCLTAATGKDVPDSGSAKGTKTTNFRFRQKRLADTAQEINRAVANGAEWRVFFFLGYFSCCF